MAKQLSKKANKRNWKKGTKTKLISIGLQSPQQRKGQILT